MQKLILWSAAAIGLVLIGLSINTARNAGGLTVIDETPAARLEKLEPGFRLIEPDGQGPHPAVVLLSGCDGVRDNMATWAEEFVAQGYLALILDSHSPRGFDRLEAWRLVCAAQVLTGAERAGDVAVALDWLQDGGMTDGTAVVLGASHGGWSALELAGLALRGQVPPGLTDWPAPSDALVGAVSGVIVLYPYCGILNRADESDWSDGPPTLMIISGQDSVVGADECREMAIRLADRGAHIRAELYEEADHGFDQKERSLVSTLKFDKEFRDRALADVIEFLATDAR
ncbi:MAG: dienelactone hydrolase family protein [Pseudomonadota bacterium]